MRLDLDFSPDSSWAWLTANSVALMTWLMLLVFISFVIAGRSGTVKLLGVGLLIGVIGMIGIGATWAYPAMWFWVVAVGFLITLVSAIAFAVGKRS